MLRESSGVGFGVAVFAAVFAADVRVYTVICQTTSIKNRSALNFSDVHGLRRLAPFDG